MTRFEFQEEIADRLIRDGGMYTNEAHDYAATILEEFLSDEGIVYGDSLYAWDEDAARELADEEMRHWEASS